MCPNDAGLLAKTMKYFKPHVPYAASLLCYAIYFAGIAICKHASSHCIVLCILSLQFKI